MVVFLVQHLHVHSDGIEDVKRIGVCSSREEALAAIERISSTLGFRDYPKLIDPLVGDAESGFSVDEITVDRDSWTSGFSTV